MSDDKENSENQGTEKIENGLEKINNDKNASKSGSRAPSRAKSRGSIGDQRKTISRPGSHLMASRPDSIVSGLLKPDDIDDDRPGTEHTFASETTAGWDTDLEIDATVLALRRKVREDYDATGRTTYKEACRLNGVIPVSYFLRHIADTELVMKHHGLGPAGSKAISIALVTNTTICKLNLSDNWLSAEGGIAIADMLRENCYITDLDLSDNKLNNSGARAVCDMLQQNNTITHLTLAGNGFEDKSAEYFAEVILNNNKLDYLNISHNDFSEVAGETLGPAIAENITMKHLDVSWNHIRRRGALALAKGVMNNIGLRKLDLSWNGFGNEGASALGEALKFNSSLEELDITNNRMSAEGAVLLGKGVVVNESLKTLRMGKNPMQTAGAFGILKAVKENPNSAIEELDFNTIQVNKDFDDLFKEAKETKPNLKVKHGGSMEEVKPKKQLNPMVKLQRFIQKNNLRLVDFFNDFDTDGSMSVTYDEFTIGLKNSGIDLSDDEINYLISQLDSDGDGEINYSELYLGYAKK